MSQLATVRNQSSAISHPTGTASCAIDYIRVSGESHHYHDLKKERDRVDVRTKLQAMLDIDRLITEQRMTKKQAVSITSARLKPYHPRGYSASILGNLHTIWKKGGQKQDARGHKTGTIYAPGDWKLFIPNYNNGADDSALNNKPFVAHIRSLFADTTRPDASGNAVRERLLDQWFAGEHIPGYGTLHQFCARAGRPVPEGYLARGRPENIPGGWSAKNIHRMLPDTATRTFLQRGEHATHSHWGDQLLRDRSNLMPMQLLTFDDVDFDIKVVQPMGPGRQDQVVRPKAIFALDVSNGMIIDFFILGSIRRTYDGQEGGKAGTSRAFNHADMRWFLAKIIEEQGIPQDWQMSILLEKAAASMSSADKHIFEQELGIRFDTTGHVRQRLTNSGFVEHGGMPWQKGWIEAYFRGFHTRTNHLPMTIGRRYDLTDGRIGGANKMGSQEHYLVGLLKKAHEQNIPLEKLKLPALTMDEFSSFVAYYVNVLNWRTNHNLQGFAEISETRLDDGTWVTFEQARQADLIEDGMHFTRRMESPIECYRRKIKGHRMHKPHPYELAHLRLDKKPITVTASRVSITRTGQDPLIFRDEQSAEALTQWNGKKKALLGFISADESCIHLFTNDDAFTHICSPRRVGRVDMTDQHALDVRMGEVHRSRTKTRDFAAQIAAPQEARLSEMREHNQEILLGGRLSPAAADIQTATAKQAADDAREAQMRNMPGDEVESLLHDESTTEQEPDYADAEWDSSELL
ncbi:MAG: hypothetical protein CML13_15920 [Puniceicoccaceae bacterium]|nr:hypothetical protein [Puniceicoccaceae bacterium]|tara:strand:- start:18299 stop:20542 length:2244 start_codon:yes stop_codon:yes gene_type:complete